MHKPIIVNTTTVIKIIMPFCAAFAVMVVLILFLQGPKLGFYYDFLNTIAPAPELAQSIVIIETDKANPEQETSSINLESFISLLLNLIEMRAESLIVQVPIYAPIQASTDESTALLNSVFSAMTAFGPVAVDELWQKMQYTDPDGMLRRIAPVMYSQAGEWVEHPVYRVLKNKSAQGSHQADAVAERIRAVDGASSLLVRVPCGEVNFIRIPFSDFINYEWLTFDLQRLLWQSDTLDIYQEISIMERPSFLGEYVQSVQDIMLEAPAPDSGPAVLQEWVQTIEQRKQLWLQARSSYFDSIERFFSQNAAQELLISYDKRTEAASGRERAGMQARRNEVEACIANIQKTYEALIYSGGSLQSRLQGALCIMGPVHTERYSAVFVSAVLANTFFTNNGISQSSRIYIVLFSLISAWFVVVLLWRFPPVKIAVLGLLCVLLIFIGFSISFVLTRYWIDPFIPSGATVAAVLCSLLCAILKPAVQGIAKPLTKELIVIAVHDTSPKKDPASFQKNVLHLFKETGAYIAEGDEDTIFIAFEMDSLEEKELAKRSADSIVTVVRSKTASTYWCFGLDTGIASLERVGKKWKLVGNPVNRAKSLALLAPRYQAHALISENAYSGLHIAAQQLGHLKDGTGSDTDSFYQLI